MKAVITFEVLVNNLLMRKYFYYPHFVNEGAHVLHTYKLAQPHKEVPAQLGFHQGPDFKFCE